MYIHTGSVFQLSLSLSLAPAIFHHHKGKLVVQRCVYTKCLKPSQVSHSLPYIRHRLVVFVLRYVYTGSVWKLSGVFLSLSHQQYFTTIKGTVTFVSSCMIKELDYNTAAVSHWMEGHIYRHVNMIGSLMVWDILVFKQSALRHNISEPHLPV